MHKNFYASGFLYHPPTQRILLHQLPAENNETSMWSLFQRKNRANEEPKITFQRSVTEAIGITPSLDQIFLIYDYFNKQRDSHSYLFYAVTLKKDEEEPMGWFTFKELTKLRIHPQMKQDIIVGQRVINHAHRLEFPEPQS